MTSQKKIVKNRELFKILSAIVLIAWIIYQAIYSVYAPDESVIWECIFYILLYMGVGLSLFNVTVKNVVIKLMFLYAGSYCIVLTGRYVYFIIEYSKDYNLYYHSLSIGWLQFKIIASVFLTGVIYAYQQWQVNK